MSARNTILKLLKARSPKLVTFGEIRRAVGIQEWPRRIRELRAEGWEIEAVSSPRGYRLVSPERRGARADRDPIDAKTRYRVLHRDHSKCRRCGRGVDDGIKLRVDHIIPRAWGGPTEDKNLWTLCEECNLGKKAWESDVNAAVMKRLLDKPSGRARLREYFKLKAGQVVTKEELQIVAGITDYQRRIRELRQDEGMDIVSHYEDSALPPGDYYLRK